MTSVQGPAGTPSVVVVGGWRALRQISPLHALHVKSRRSSHVTPDPLPSFCETDRFQILRRIGSGGMGTVYEALDRERNVHIALKALHNMDAESLLGFKNEFRDFQHLQHPNLVSIGELFSNEGQWFL